MILKCYWVFAGWGWVSGFSLRLDGRVDGDQGRGDVGEDEGVGSRREMEKEEMKGRND